MAISGTDFFTKWELVSSNKHGKGIDNGQVKVFGWQQICKSNIQVQANYKRDNKRDGLIVQ